MVLSGAPLLPAPNPKGPPNSHRERRMRQRRGGLPWSKLPAGEAEDRAGLLCVSRLGSCAGFPKARQPFIKAGAATGPGPSLELAGQLKANRKVQ